MIGIKGGKGKPFEHCSSALEHGDNKIRATSGGAALTHDRGLLMKVRICVKVVVALLLNFIEGQRFALGPNHEEVERTREIWSTRFNKNSRCYGNTWAYIGENNSIICNMYMGISL
jgi:hypothetical protein